MAHDEYKIPDIESITSKFKSIYGTDEWMRLPNAYKEIEGLSWIDPTVLFEDYFLSFRLQMFSKQILRVFGTDSVYTIYRNDKFSTTNNSIYLYRHHRDNIFVGTRNYQEKSTPIILFSTNTPINFPQTPNFIKLNSIAIKKNS